MNKLRFSGSIGGVLRQQTSSSSDAGCGSQQQQPQQSRVPGQSSQCSRHRRRCNTGSTALALYKQRREIFGSTEALPLSTLSTVPGKSVALARRTLRRLGAHAINSSSSSSSSRRVVNYIASQQHAPMRRSTGYRPGGRPLNLHRTCMLARRGAAGDVQSHTNDTTRLRPTHRDAGMT